MTMNNEDFQSVWQQQISTKEQGQILKRLWTFVWLYKGELLTAVLGMVAVSAINMLLPTWLRYYMDHYLKAGKVDFSTFYYVALIYGIGVVFKAVCQFTYEYLYALAGEKAVDEQAAVRSARIGFVFQSFHLVPRLTAAENIALPMTLAGIWGMNFKAMTAYLVGTYAAMILGKVLAGVAAERDGLRVVEHRDRLGDEHRRALVDLAGVDEGDHPLDARVVGRQEAGGGDQEQAAHHGDEAEQAHHQEGLAPAKDLTNPGAKRHACHQGDREAAEHDGDGARRLLLGHQPGGDGAAHREEDPVGQPGKDAGHNQALVPGGLPGQQVADGEEGHQPHQQPLARQLAGERREHGGTDSHAKGIEADQQARRGERDIELLGYGGDQPPRSQTRWYRSQRHSG